MHLTDTPTFTAPVNSKAISRTLTLLLALITIFCGVLTRTANAAEMRVTVVRSAAASPSLRGAHLLSHLNPKQVITAGLTLPLRNQGQLSALLQKLYTPGDPQYRKFLTPSQFTAQFGPTVQDYTAVANFARSQGLIVTGTHAGRTLLDVAGPVSSVEAAFGVRLSHYRLRDGRQVYANSAAPRLPRSIAARLAGVVGLSSLSRMHPQIQRMRAARSLLATNTPLPGSGGNGSGPDGGLTPTDIKYAYSLDSITTLYPSTTNTTGTSTPLDGTGQNVGVFELDGYLPSDIGQYITKFSLPTPTKTTTMTTGTTTTTVTVPTTVQNVLLGNFNGAVLTPDGQAEVTMDIDMVLALAPNLDGLYVYEADQTTDTTAALDIFTKMANDTDATTGAPLLQVICCCWGLPELQEDSATRDGENTLFQQMAAQGQSVFSASGDQGAYDDYDPTNPTVYTLSVDNPASQPYNTGVGGTSLTYNAPKAATTTTAATVGQYVSESTWNTSGPTSVNGPEAGGGGISQIWTKPSYQKQLGASPTFRDVPDVSLDADPDTGYDIYVQGAVETDGGTSAAAPLWAGFAALVNQQRLSNGLTTTLGFANPSLYAIGTGTSYLSDFHDISDGSTNLYYPAVAGYDDATGLGSFIGDTLLAELSYNADQGTSTATLTGTVTTTDGTAIAGATITVKSTSTGTVKATTTTDGSGNYTVTIPSDLTLTIAVDASTATSPTESYLGTSVSGLTETAGGTLTENFTLSVAHVYAAGLQMFSSPFDYTAVGDFAVIFGLTPPLRSPTARLIQWEPSLNAYVFYPTSPADTLRLGQGYWVKFPAATAIGVAGTAAPITQPFLITLTPGWNQIGDPFTAAAPLSTITVTATGSSTSTTIASGTSVGSVLYRYDTTTGAYDALSATTDSLQPYDGVWIFARTSVVLTVPVPDSLTVPGAPTI